MLTLEEILQAEQMVCSIIAEDEDEYITQESIRELEYYRKNLFI